MEDKSLPTRVVKTVLGVDPGTNFTGYGVLDVSGKDPRCIVLGHIDLSRYNDPYQKLRVIFERVSALIDEYKPDEVALESPFFGENVQSMLKLGRAQGVAMAAALTKGLKVYEYAPRRIKQSISGNGGASKEQVATLLKSILKIEYELKSLDATDGLAVALCHYLDQSSAINRLSAQTEGSSISSQINKAKSGGCSRSWESFLAKNPEREIGKDKCRTDSPRRKRGEKDREVFKISKKDL